VGAVNAQVIVVGAGPAGTAVAIQLAERGADVLVLERAEFPRPKLCGEYLSPEVGRVLDRLGVLKAVDEVAAPLIGMRIIAPDGTSVVGTYRAHGPWGPYRAHAMAVARATLDRVLADRLRALPVDFRERVRVTDVMCEGSQVVGVEAVGPEGQARVFIAPLVIGADGRTSVIAHRLGLRRPHRLRRLALVTYVSGLTDAREYGEIFVDPPDYAILNPIETDRVNLSLVVPLSHASRFRGRLETFFAARVKHLPHLARRLAGAQWEMPVRALGPLAYRVGRPRHGGVMLIGDAGGFYDPFTGEGVYRALHEAELAAETAARALKRGNYSAAALGEFARARRHAFRDKERLTRVLHLIIGHRWLANAAARALVRRPALLDQLLGVIGDFVPPRALLTRGQ